MASMSYDVVKNDISNTLQTFQQKLDTEDFSIHSKEDLECRINLYQYVDETVDMNYYFNGY